jgi:Spy/CpxP family protein refolding chaperone
MKVTLPFQTDHGGGRRRAGQNGLARHLTAGRGRKSMKKGFCFISIVLSLLAATSGAWAEAASREASPKPKKQGLAGEYALIAKEAGLSDEQIAKLTELVQANKEQLIAAEKRHKEAKTALDAAKAKKDEQAIAAAKAEVQASAEDKNQLREKLQKEIQDLLTPQQKAKWEAFMLYRSLAKKLAKANLSDAQKEQLRKLAASAGEELAKAKDAKARQEIMARMEKAAKALLTK